MNNSSKKRMLFLWLLAAIVLSNVASSQTTTTVATSTETSPTHKFTEEERQNRIKWSWQLPHSIRKAFNQSMLCNWYIEKMVSNSADGKTAYAFYLDNRNLLDGDHYPSFFKKKRLTLADDGTVIDTVISDNNQ